MVMQMVISDVFWLTFWDRVLLHRAGLSRQRRSALPTNPSCHFAFGERDFEEEYFIMLH